MTPFTLHIVIWSIVKTKIQIIAALKSIIYGCLFIHVAITAHANYPTKLEALARKYLLYHIYTIV